MPTLTPSQYDDYRFLAGATLSPEGEITDAMIQGWYDDAYALGYNADITPARTVVAILWRLRGLARRKIDVRGEVEAESRNQLFKNLGELIKEWEARAGMTGGASGMIQTGVLSFGIDYTEEDYEAEWDS